MCRGYICFRELFILYMYNVYRITGATRTLLGYMYTYLVYALCTLYSTYIDIRSSRGNNLKVIYVSALLYIKHSHAGYHEPQILIQGFGHLRVRDT